MKKMAKEEIDSQEDEVLEEDQVSEEEIVAEEETVEDTGVDIEEDVNALLGGEELSRGIQRESKSNL